MHARIIHNVLAPGRIVQKGESHPPNPPANHTLNINKKLNGYTLTSLIAK